MTVMGLHDESHEGWLTCDAGHRHWGRHGAAGVLLVRPQQAGPVVLLQLRAAWCDESGTWGVPGGALKPGESEGRAALRELKEETGIEPDTVALVRRHESDHGGWRYTTMVGVCGERHRLRPNNESDELRWVHIGDVARYSLHPGLAEAWPDLLPELDRDLRPVPTLAPVAPMRTVSPILRRYSVR